MGEAQLRGDREGRAVISEGQGEARARPRAQTGGEPERAQLELDAARAGHELPPLTLDEVVDQARVLDRLAQDHRLGQTARRHRDFLQAVQYQRAAIGGAGVADRHHHGLAEGADGYTVRTRVAGDRGERFTGASATPRGAWRAPAPPP